MNAYRVCQCDICHKEPATEEGVLTNREGVPDRVFLCHDCGAQQSRERYDYAGSVGHRSKL